MRRVFTQRLAGAGGYLGCPAGWLELRQSNSALIASCSQNVGAFCHRRQKYARGAAAAGSGRRQPGKQPRASRRRLRHLCWSICPRNRGAREAGSRRGPGVARNRESPGAANSSGTRCRQPAAAGSSRRPATARRRGNREPLGGTGNREPLGAGIAEASWVPGITSSRIF